MDVDPERKRKFWAYSILGLMIITSLWYYHLNPLYMYLVAYLWFGFTYGILMQYGRFCFASAWRDLIAIGVTRMFIGILIALATFSLVLAVLATKQMSTFHPGPLGPNELIGGLLFGIGMTLAGGCASGTLYKTGEGNGTSWLALFGIVFSQAIFVDYGGFFDTFLTGYAFKEPLITLSQYFPNLGPFKYVVGNSIINVIIPVIILIVLAYYIVARKGIMRRLMESKTASADGGVPKPTIGDDMKGIWLMITASKRTAIAGILLGIVSGIHVFTIQSLRYRDGINNFGQILWHLGFVNQVSSLHTVFDPGYWYITTQEAQFGAWVMEHLGINMRNNIFYGTMNGIPAPWHNPPLLMSIGIILGAATIALMNNEFKLKMPNRELAVWGLLGGIFMGIGARLAFGCNIGAFYIRVAGGDPGGWLFFAGMGAGALGGVKMFNWWTNRKLASDLADFDIDL